MSGDQFINGRMFCMAPWVHLHVLPNGNAYPCCVSSWSKPLANTNRSRLQEIWNNEAMREIRLRMLKGEYIPECTKCYEWESAGLWSYRMEKFNRNYSGYLDVVNATGPDGTVEDFNLRYWDFRFSNTCNFMCRSCGSTSSSKFGKVHHAGDLLPKLLEMIEQVEEIYLGGGEPFLMEENYVILERLIELGKDVKIEINTNMSVLGIKNKSMLDLLKHFSDVTVKGSVEGIGEQYEYIRKGGNYAQIKQNRRIFKERCPRVKFILAPTVSHLSIWSVADLHREWYEEGLIDGIDQIHLNTLIKPEFLSIQILPEPAKRYLQEMLREHIDWIRTKGGGEQTIDGFANLAQYLMHKEKNIQSLVTLFAVTNQRLDEKRNESYARTFPLAYRFYLESIEPEYRIFKELG